MNHKQVTQLWRTIETIDARFNRNIPMPDMLALRRIALRLHRYAEIECNGIDRYDPVAKCVCGSWTDADDAKYTRLTDKAVREAQSIASQHDLSIYHQTDPRGWMLYLHIPADSERIDSTYSSVGIGIPQ